ncbi:DUF1287 domain-containing protein [Enhygromyxa salina]|uniref:DUF1287 domain-containing protein n=1 Tax=Enhygromyxa salina TaxID=215803 RepID=UPI0015E61EF7|nr:DUF1287 domain-containing protein [Enhygromyxa salina]
MNRVLRGGLALIGLGLGLGCRPTSQAPEGESADPRPASSPAAALEASTPEPEPEPAQPEATLGVADVGIFADLDPRVQIELDPDLSPARAFARIDDTHGLLVLYADDWPVKVYPLVEDGGRALSVSKTVSVKLRAGDHAELAPLLRAPEQLRHLAPGACPPPGDLDGDGIPDPLDINLGAIKTTLNAATYDQRYIAIPYPGGDVPRELGACTDVIVRALRNAGIDLQAELHEDIARAPWRYPMVERANDDIDHRRVRTLLPWFRAHWTSLADDEAARPGDVVFMDTIPSRKGPDHIGVIGDRRGDEGRLLVANNWTDGYETAFMDLLGAVELTDRFRVPPTTNDCLSPSPISADVRQLVVVVGESWDGFHGEARRFERDSSGGPWRPVGAAFPVVLGHSGLAWGRGLHGDGPPAELAGPTKREGDGRSPAGVFAIGDAWGRAETAPPTQLRYTSESPTLRCVDDANSQHYNQIVDSATTPEDWGSAEPMRRYYELAIVVEHNLARVTEAGSCIFLHRWKDAQSPVTGCTAMAGDDLDQLAAWLEPGAVLVSLPRPALAELASRWALPG